MRSFANLLIGIGVILFVAFATKPPDQDIRKKVIERLTGHGVVSALLTRTGVSNIVIDVQDMGFYKCVYNSIDGTIIGYAFFGSVMFAS